MVLKLDYVTGSPEGLVKRQVVGLRLWVSGALTQSSDSIGLEWGDAEPAGPGTPHFENHS